MVKTQQTNIRLYGGRGPHSPCKVIRSQGMTHSFFTVLKAQRALYRRNTDREETMQLDAPDITNRVMISDIAGAEEVLEDTEGVMWLLRSDRCTHACVVQTECRISAHVLCHPISELRCALNRSPGPRVDFSGATCLKLYPAETYFQLSDRQSFEREICPPAVEYYLANGGASQRQEMERDCSRRRDLRTSPSSGIPTCPTCSSSSTAGPIRIYA